MNKKLVLLLVIGMIFGLAVSAISAVPKTINLQGRLLDVENKPISGQKTIAITLINSGDQPISTEQQFAITLINGVFSINFDVSSISNFASPYKFLVKVDGVSMPLQSLASVPYALNSETVGGYSILNIATKDASGNIFGYPQASSIVTKDAQGNILDINLGNYVKKSGDNMYGTLTVTREVAGQNMPFFGIKGKLATTGYPEGYLGYLDQPSGPGTSLVYYGVYGYASTSESTGNKTVGVFGKAGKYGLEGEATKTTGIGVRGVGKLAGGSFEANSIEGYSGYFIGGKGVRIVGSLEVTGTANIVGGLDYVKKSGDVMNGSLQVNASKMALITVSTYETENGPIGFYGIPNGSVGVYGSGLSAVSAYSEKNYGIYSRTNAESKSAVYGENLANAGLGIVGLYGKANQGYGVVGEGLTRGVVGSASAEFGRGISGFAGKGIGVYGQSNSTTNPGVYAKNSFGGPAIVAEGVIVGSGTMPATGVDLNLPLTTNWASDSLTLGSQKGGWDVLINDDLVVRDALSVGGRTFISDDLSVEGKANIKGNLKITGKLLGAYDESKIISPMYFNEYGTIYLREYQRKNTSDSPYYNPGAGFEYMGTDWFGKTIVPFANAIPKEAEILSVSATFKDPAKPYREVVNADWIRIAQPGSQYQYTIFVRIPSNNESMARSVKVVAIYKIL